MMLPIFAKWPPRCDVSKQAFPPVAIPKASYASSSLTRTRVCDKDSELMAN